MKDGDGKSRKNLALLGSYENDSILSAVYWKTRWRGRDALPIFTTWTNFKIVMRTI